LESGQTRVDGCGGAAFGRVFRVNGVELTIRRIFRIKLERDQTARVTGIVVEFPKDFLEVHSEPKNGKYQKVQKLKRGKTLASTTISGLKLDVDDILG
jgi:ribosomal protein L13E